MTPRRGTGRARLAGLTVLGVSAGAALLATTFRVSFPTDPLGPRAFPLVSAALLAIGALSLFRADEKPHPWPDAPGMRRIGLAVLGFVAYALLLAPVGFVVATAAVFFVLALLFGGRALPALAAGVGAAVLLYVLFVYGLGLPLPLGDVFGSLFG